MDPNTALHVLRIDPFEPLTVAAIDAAYAREAAARHPSRYPDAAGRQSAEGWAVALATARVTLLSELPPQLVATAAAASQPRDAAGGPSRSRSPRRGLPLGAVIGIIAGVLVLIAGSTAISIGAVAFTQQLATFTSRVSQAPVEVPAEEDGPAADEDQSAAEDLPAVEHVTFEETGFWFETALEVYHDGRLGECPAKFEDGCWQSALIPEASCGMLEIQYSFSNDPNSELGEETRSTQRTNIVVGEPVELVFGNDEYEYGWVSFVSCLAPPTQPPAG